MRPSRGRERPFSANHARAPASEASWALAWRSAVAVIAIVSLFLRDGPGSMACDKHRPCTRPRPAGQPPPRREPAGGHPLRVIPRWRRLPVLGRALGGSALAVDAGLLARIVSTATGVAGLAARDPLLLALLRAALALVSHPLALVRQSLALVGRLLAPGSRLLALVRPPLARVRDALAVLHVALALLHGARILGHGPSLSRASPPPTIRAASSTLARS